MARTERGREIIAQLSKARALESINEEDTNFGDCINQRLPIIRSQVEQGEDVWELIIGLFGAGKTYLSKLLFELFNEEFPDWSRAGLIGRVDFEDGRDQAIALKEEQMKRQPERVIIQSTTRTLADVDSYNYHFEQIIKKKKEQHRLLLITSAVKTGVIFNNQLIGINGGSLFFYRLLRREPPYHDVGHLTLSVDDIVGNYYTHYMAIRRRGAMQALADREVDIQTANVILRKHGEKEITSIEQLQKARRDGAPPYLQIGAYGKYKQMIAQLERASPEMYAPLEEYVGVDRIVYEELIPSVYLREDVTECNPHFSLCDYKIWHNDPTEFDLSYFTL